MCTDAVFIVQDPENVTNATLGSTIRFECVMSRQSFFPGWNINGIDYAVTDLPLGHSFMRESYTMILIVGPLQMAMNNSCYYCYLENFEGREESSRAKLIIIQLLINKKTSILLSSNNPATTTYTTTTAIHTISPYSETMYIQTSCLTPHNTITSLTIARSVAVHKVLPSVFSSHKNSRPTHHRGSYMGYV